MNNARETAANKGFFKSVLGLLFLCFFLNQVMPCYGEIKRYQPDEADKANGLFFYTKPLFEVVPLSYSPRDKEVVKDKISFFAAQNEYEPVTFYLYAIQGLKDVKVSVGDLTCGSNTIPSSALDVRLVKWWEQQDTDGGSAADGKRIFVPDLLVKDDRIVLKGHFASMPLTPYAATDIPAGSAKQFWVILKTSPETAKPGTYSGFINIETSGGVKSRLGLEVKVLPITLFPPNKTYAIYYSGSAFNLHGDVWWKNYRGETEKEQEETVRKELKDIKEHGFQSAMIITGLTGSTKTGELVLDFSNLKKALQLHREAGLTGPTSLEMGYSKIDGRGTLDLRSYEKSPAGRKLFYYTWEKVVKQVEEFNKKEFNGTPQLFYYGVDEANRNPNVYPGEPDLAPDYGVGVCKNMFEATHRGGGLTTSAQYRSVDYGGFDLLDSLTDLPVYSYGAVYPGTTPETIKEEAKRKKGVWYYWQCWVKNPKQNRILAGLFLWKSGATGVAPFTYMGITGEPYQDWGENPLWFLGGKDMCVAYPSKEGPIPTLNWESMREGIDDVRYLTTLTELISKEKDTAKTRKAEQVMEEILRGVSLNPTDILFDITEGDLQTFRGKLAQAIMEITK